MTDGQCPIFVLIGRRSSVIPTPSPKTDTVPLIPRLSRQEMTMRRVRWLMLGLALSAGVVAAGAVPADKPRELGKGPAYETLARLVVLHQGRLKPLDTLAR